jgi:hypothetical protein
VGPKVTAAAAAAATTCLELDMLNIRRLLGVESSILHDTDATIPPIDYCWDLTIDKVAYEQMPKAESLDPLYCIPSAI